MKRAAMCAVAVTAVLSGVLAGCGGSRSQPGSTPNAPPATGLPVAGRTQDVANETNERTSQLEQQTGSDHP